MSSYTISVPVSCLLNSKKNHSPDCMKFKNHRLFIFLFASAFTGAFIAVSLNSFGHWPKWLGGNYVSSVGCQCEDYDAGPNERDFHWMFCPIRSMWGLNDTGLMSTAIVHYGGGCEEHELEGAKGRKG